MTSTLKINTIEPEGATTTLTVGESGQDTVIAGAGIKANVLKDAGANAIFTSNGSGVLSGLNSAFGSAQVLITTQTASDSATITFTGIDNTYKEYVFEFINILPATSGAQFNFQVSSDGTNYNKTMTTTFFRAKHFENDSGTAFNFEAGASQEQGTSYQTISSSLNYDADAGTSGTMSLYNPSSTVYVKNYYTTFSSACYDAGALPYIQEVFGAGYINETGAFTSIRFQMSSGNITAGKIKMYGIK